MRKIPRVKSQKELIVTAHEAVLHRCKEQTFHKLKQMWYWSSMKETIMHVMKKCVVCSKNNRRKGKGRKFITISWPIKKSSCWYCRCRLGPDHSSADDGTNCWWKFHYMRIAVVSRCGCARVAALVAPCFVIALGANSFSILSFNF